MKKFKKLCALVALTAAGCMAAFAGCGDNTPDDDSGKNPDEGTSSVKALQFTGGYHDLRSFNMDFFILADMREGGEGSIYLATYMGNPDNIGYGEIAVEWSVETDRDGLTIFNAKTDDSNATFSKVSLYQESDGSFIWEYNFTFAGGYNRTTNLTGSETITYTLDSWKDYVKENVKGEDKSEEPDTPVGESSYTFTGLEIIQVSTGKTLSNMGIKVTLNADGTAKAERGYAAGGNIAYVYSSEEGSWTKEGDVLTITFGDNTYTAEKKDGAYSFTYKTSSAEEGEMTALVTCASENK